MSPRHNVSAGNVPQASHTVAAGLWNYAGSAVHLFIYILGYYASHYASVAYLMARGSYNLSSLVLFSVVFSRVQSWHFRKINIFVTGWWPQPSFKSVGGKSDAVDVLRCLFYDVTAKLYMIQPLPLPGDYSFSIQKKVYSMYKENRCTCRIM